MSAGWLKLWRKAFYRDDWLKPTKKNPASYLHAWLDLCQMAQHSEYEHAGSRLGPGEVMVSISFLQDRWQWPRKKVRYFLDRLISDTMLGTVSGTGSGTIYRVVNYGTYNDPGSELGHTLGHSLGHTLGTVGAPEQERRKKKEAIPVTKTRARKTQLPESWTPTDSHRERALKSRVDVDREAEKFRLHAETNARKAMNWNSAFTSWLIKAEEWAKPSNVEQPTGPNTGSLRSQLEAM